MSNLADALLAGVRAAPSLDPGMLYGVAQTSTVDTAADNATATQAFGDITKRKSYLEAQENNVQASAWASAGDSERQMLTAAGYTPPALHKSSTGPFAAVGHFLGDVAEATLVKPAEGIAHGVGEALHYAGAPLRQLQHVQRTVSLMELGGGAEALKAAETALNPLLQLKQGISGAVAVATGHDQAPTPGRLLSLSPSEWAQAWRNTNHGEQTFNPNELRKLQDRYSPDTLDVAKQLAAGVKPDVLIARQPEQDRQAFVQRLQSDSDLQQAVADLNNAKLSPGRLIVGTDLQASHPLLGRVLSGGIDGLYDWFGDPLVIGGKVAKGAETARFLVQGPDDIERLANNSKQVQRALSDVTDTLNAGGAEALIQRWPKLAPVVPQLVREGVDSPEKLATWFQGQSGMAAMLSGRAGGALRDGVQMIHLSPVDRAALATKGGLRTAIDWAADPARIARQTGDDQALSLLDQAKVRIARKAEAVKQFTTLTAKGRTLNIEDPNAITTIQRLANYVLPSERVTDVTNAWAAAETVSEKRQIYKGLLNEMFDAANVDGAFRERFTSQFDEAVRRPVFSGSGADQVVRDGVDTRVGLDAPHFTTEWAMPSYRDLSKEANRVGTLNRVYNGTINSDGVDRFMNNVWKPSMLLRFGFPIRAGGEELVGAVLREGLAGIVRGRLAAGASEAEALNAARAADDLRALERVRVSGSAEVKTAGGVIREGGYVRAADRSNFGRVVSIDEANNQAVVHFINKAEGTEAKVSLSLDTLRSTDPTRGIAPDRLLPFHPLARVWDRYAGSLPEQLRSTIEAPGDFAGAVIGDRARRAFRFVEGKLAGQDYMNAARELWRAGPLQEAFTSEIAATESRAAGYLDDGPSVVKVAKSGGQARPAYFAPTGDFREYQPKDTLYVHQWKKGLDELGQGPLFRVALEGVGGDREAQVQAVVDRIESPGYAKMRDFADRSRFTTDGRVVGVDATAAEAHLDWANAVVDHTNSLVHTEQGDVIPDLASRVLADRRGPAVAELSDHPFDQLPGPVKGREMVAVSRNWVRDVMDRGFEQVVGKPMDWMVRQPLFVHNYAVSLQEAEALRPLVGAQALKVEDLVYHGTPTMTAGAIRSEGLNPGSYFSADPARAAGFGRSKDGHLVKVRGDPSGHTVFAVPKADIVPSGAKAGDIFGQEFIKAGAAIRSGAAHVAPIEIPSSVAQRGSAAVQEFLDARHLSTNALADEHIRQIAVERATAKTIPFIHDAQMRSQFSVTTRNLAPFWFAQEQFYKRWINVAKHSPEAFREAQLTMMGLRHSGVIHTDDQGNDYFIYPAASVVQDAISKGFEALTGKKVSLPLPIGFSGQVRFATPGLERLGVPSFGPLVGIPMHAMAQRFPELAPVEAGVLGDRGAGRAYWEQITPTAVSRLVHVATDNPNTSPQMASAMMQAMAYLEAKGFAPADNASPVEKEAYIDRVKNWTRILFLNRTLFGYAAPASPELQMDPDQLHSRYLKLLSQLPIDEAVGEFLKEYPDATPYTVFKSKSASGASLPATQQAADFMANNEAFLRTYPQAGGWFVPQAPSDTKFSLPAYREQLALQMRQQKSPEQFYSDLKYTEAADQYFTNRDRKDVMLEGVNGPTAKKLAASNPALLAQFVSEGAGSKAAGARLQNINQAWSTWKGEFLTSHPVFGAELQSPDAKIQRQQALDQTRLALQDPRLPASPQVDGIRTLVAGFDQAQQALRPLLGLTTTRATTQRKAIKGALQTWIEQYVVDHPTAKGFYDRVLRAQVEA